MDEAERKLVDPSENVDAHPFLTSKGCAATSYNGYIYHEDRRGDGKYVYHYCPECKVRLPVDMRKHVPAFDKTFCIAQLPFKFDRPYNIEHSHDPWRSLQH